MSQEQVDELTLKSEDGGEVLLTVPEGVTLVEMLQSLRDSCLRAAELRPLRLRDLDIETAVTIISEHFKKEFPGSKFIL